MVALSGVCLAHRHASRRLARARCDPRSPWCKRLVARGIARWELGNGWPIGQLHRLATRAPCPLILGESGAKVNDQFTGFAQARPVFFHEIFVAPLKRDGESLLGSQTVNPRY